MNVCILLYLDYDYYMKTTRIYWAMRIQMFERRCCMLPRQLLRRDHLGAALPYIPHQPTRDERWDHVIYNSQSEMREGTHYPISLTPPLSQNPYISLADRWRLNQTCVPDRVWGRWCLGRVSGCLNRCDPEQWATTLNVVVLSWYLIVKPILVMEFTLWWVVL